MAKLLRLHSLEERDCAKGDYQLHVRVEMCSLESQDRFGDARVSDAESRPRLESSDVAGREIGHRIHKVERRDWWLWGTAVLIMLLLASLDYSLILLAKK